MLGPVAKQDHGEESVVEIVARVVARVVSHGSYWCVSMCVSMFSVSKTFCCQLNFFLVVKKKEEKTVERLQRLHGVPSSICGTPKFDGR